MSDSLELRVAFHGRSFRWPLRDGDVIEIWQGAFYCGELPATIVRQLLGFHLATAKVVAELLQALERPSERRRYYQGKPPARAAGRREKSRPRAASVR